MTTPPDSYVLNYRELPALLTLSESLAAEGFKPLTIGSMRNNLTTELSQHKSSCNEVEDIDRKFRAIESDMVSAG